MAEENDDDDDDDDNGHGKSKGKGKGDEAVDGEEEDGTEKFNDVGEVLMPFNLKEDREGGRFDDNMNYVWAKEHREVDTWLADLDEATMERRYDFHIAVFYMICNIFTTDE